MLYSYSARVDDIILESYSVEQVVKTAKNLSKRIYQEGISVLTSTLPNPLLEDGSYTVFAPKGLKDSEARALALFCLQFRETLVSWKIHECLEREAEFTKNPQLALLLNCRSISEAVYRLGNLDPSLLSKVYRNYKENAMSGLRKLRVFYKKSNKVKVPVRRKGYNDKGSIDPDSAWKNARAFWLDTELQLTIEKNRQAYKDTVALLQGFTD